MQLLSSLELRKPCRLRWPSIVAALLSIVAGLALVLLLVVTGLRCVDTYRLIAASRTAQLTAPYSVSRSESALYAAVLPVWAHGAFGIRTPDAGAP